MAEQRRDLAGYFEQSGSGEWHSLLRGTQGEPEAILECGYVVDEGDSWAGSTSSTPMPKRSASTMTTAHPPPVAVVSPAQRRCFSAFADRYDEEDEDRGEDYDPGE